MASMDQRQELIQRAKQAAARLGQTTLTRAEFARETGISPSQIYQHFDGLRDLCRQAGLEAHERNVRLDDDQIYSAMREAFVALGGITPRHRFNRAFRYSVDVFKKRGLNWPMTLMAFRRWCEQNDPGFPYLDDLPTHTEAPIHNELTADPPTSLVPSGVAWRPGTGKVYGEFLNFRDLQHAPVNEQSVVLLFGMIAHELG
jgi:hypothetical protein